MPRRVPLYRVQKGRYSLPAVPRVCAMCGIDFLAIQQSVDKGEGRFCSRSCAAKHTRPSQHMTKRGPDHHNYTTGHFVNGKTDPLVRSAHDHVGYALERGYMVRQPCERCGEPKTDAHHDDYSKPLDVRWLCRKCHNAHHGNVKETARSRRKTEEQLADDEYFRTGTRYPGQ